MPLMGKVMPRNANRPGTAAQPTRIADLRASLRAASEPQLAKPPKPRKAPKRESDDERAAKAEKVAMAQHRTSLLKGGDSSKPYLRPGERPERKKGGLVAQLIIVMVVAVGVAYALDPTIVPAEWTEKAHEFLSQYIKL